MQNIILCKRKKMVKYIEMKLVEIYINTKWNFME